MSKLSKIILIVVAVIVAIFCVIAISINLYLQSQGVQQRISKSISTAIRSAVTIQNTSYTPWEGMVLSEITISKDANIDKSNPALLTIAKARLHIAWLPLLFQRRVLFSSIKIEGPTLMLAEPGTPPDFLSDSSIHSPSADHSATPSQLSTTTVALPAAKPGQKSTTPNSAPLSKILITQGKFLFLSKQGRRTVVAEGIEAQLHSTGNGQFTGPLTCANAIVINSLFFKDLRASLSCSPQVVEARSITGAFAGGKVQGEFTCRLSKPSAFQINVNGGNISVRKLLEQAGYQAGGSSGSLQGDVWISKDKNNLDGRGTIELLQGQLEPIDFLRQLGQVLRIQELELLHLKKAIATFRIQRDQLVFDDVFLESENLILRGTGPVNFDSNLNIAAQLLFNEHLYKQYHSLIGKSLSPSSIPGYYEVPFHITGNLSSPRSDLLDKLIGIRIRGNVGGFLRQLMGWPSKESKQQ